RESVVIRALFSFLIDSSTATPAPESSTFVTLPTSTPAIRTRAPLFSPCTLSNVVFSSYRSQAKPLAPPHATNSIAVSASAAIAMRPIFSSDQASDRVRGILFFPSSLLLVFSSSRLGPRRLRQKRSDVLVRLARSAQL